MAVATMPSAAVGQEAEVIRGLRAQVAALQAMVADLQAKLGEASDGRPTLWAQVIEQQEVTRCNS